MSNDEKTPLLSVDKLSVAFTVSGNTSVAVDEVSFEINRGETVALVGESGSGKSVTALSVLKLLPYPSASHPSGNVYFKGEDLLDSDERDLRRVRGDDITMIFQEPMTSLNPLHTIERQIGEILSIHQGMGETKARETHAGTIEPGWYSGTGKTIGRLSASTLRRAETTGDDCHVPGK